MAHTTLHSGHGHGHDFTSRRACELGQYARPVVAATLRSYVAPTPSRVSRPATAATYGMTAAQFEVFNAKMAAAKAARQARAAGAR